MGMFNVPGPLWIDTFIRQNFTSDTNGMMVRLLREFAEAEEFLGNTTGAMFYSRMANQLVVGMNTYLWDKGSKDHYITELNPDMSTRDFVDYDSQLIAVAFGVPPTMEAARAILRRVDSGPCTHPRGTWVSEKYYGSSDCNAGNTGDSAITMGRIAWVDALARKVVGDIKLFEEKLLIPLQNDLLRNTFMYERYQCQGFPTHNSHYIEYPEVVAMMLREVRYGIDLGFNHVTVNGAGVSAYVWRVGNVLVEYSGAFVRMQVPCSGVKTVNIAGMIPNTMFTAVSDDQKTGKKIEQQVVSDGLGNLSCKMQMGEDWVNTIVVTSK